jgi:hypothetical protein
VLLLCSQHYQYCSQKGKKHKQAGIDVCILHRQWWNLRKSVYHIMYTLIYSLGFPVKITALGKLQCRSGHDVFDRFPEAIFSELTSNWKGFLKYKKWIAKTGRIWFKSWKNTVTFIMMPILIFAYHLCCFSIINQCNNSLNHFY